MSFNLPSYRSFVRKAMMASLGGLLVSSLGAASALAQISLPTREQPSITLREILETLNERPVAPAEEASPPATPVFERPEDPAADISASDTAEQTVHLRLSLSDRKVYVYRGETLETSYPVAIGRPGWETPTGEFEVFSQIVDPGWTNPLTDEVVAPGPNNPLGDRWIAFWTDGVNSIGFHGTPNRESVGQAASHGCIRMYNEDVRELYEIVALGTPVTVEP